jgi:alcohol dehydrogenase (quinone), cytochrome c subunit
VARRLRESSLILTAGLAVALLACVFARAATPDNNADPGRYLVTAGNCIGCHTAKNGQPFAGGSAIITPLGTIYSTNITPDTETGIGRWTLSDFTRALREGIAADGHRLFPAFPYTSFTKVNDHDAAAMFAYLRTLSPVRYAPPANDIVLRQRWGVALWNASYFEPGRYVPDPAHSAEWNRGAYLTLGLGHCGACHTPRNLLLAEIPSRAFAGGDLQISRGDEQPLYWSAVNLTPSSTGLGGWSVDDIVKYLSVGFTQRGGAFGPMNEVIVNSTRHLSPDDLHAIAVYLKALPAREPNVDPTPTAEQTKAGAIVYADRCETCHIASGRGGILKAPRLAGSAVVQAENPASLINIILRGADAPTDALGAFAGWETMKPYKDVLSDEETAAVANFVRNSWGNKARAVTPREVARQR